MRIAMAQIPVAGGDPETNLRQAAAAIRRAADHGCRAVVLPECLNYGWTHPGARNAPPIPGAHAEALSQAAVASHIWVAAGLAEKAGDRVYNAAVLISPAGEIVLHHRKINELALAHDLYALGTKLEVADTDLGRVGLLICADNFPDSLELGHALGRMGCTLILSPCAWAVSGDHDNSAEPYGALWQQSYAELTTRFPLTLVGVSNVGPVSAGPWAGRKCIGCSLAVGPGGHILARAPYGEDAESLEIIEVEAPEISANVSSLAASRT